MSVARSEQVREAVRRGARAEAGERRITRGVPTRQPRVARPAQARPPQRPHLRLVPNVKRRRRVRLTMVIASTIFAVMIGLTAFQITLAQRQLEIDRVEQSVELARERFTELRKENAGLRAPERIVARAEELGMVPGRPTRYATVPADVAHAVAAASGPLLDSEVTGESDPFAEHERVKRILSGDAP